MSQKTTTPASNDVRALSEEEIDAVSGGAKNSFWRAVDWGILMAIAKETAAGADVLLNSK